MFLMALSIAACGGGGDNPAPATDTTQTTTPTDTTTTTTTPTTTTPPSTTAPVTPAAPTAPEAQAAATPQILTGIFVDAPTEGISFVSGAQTGVTDAAGTFKFEAGGTVQFKVGNVTLGRAPGKALMTPLDLVKAVDATAVVADPRVTQIGQFLLTLDSIPADAKITVSAAAVTNALNETAVDLSQAQVDVAAILGRLVPTKVPVTAADALAHLQATIAAQTIPVALRAGTFAAVDSAAAPTLGLQLKVAPNAAGDAFDVTGVAATIAGDIWNVAGTMTIDGSLSATGTLTGAATKMVITGSMTAATQITASANFTLNAVAKQVPLVFEKAVAPLVTGKFGLPADAGVATVAGDLVHVGADMNILADGTLTAHVVRGQVTGIVALAAIYSDHFAGLTGVVTSTNNIIAMGGVTANDGALNINGKTTTTPSPVTFFTGSLDTAAATAAVKMTAQDLNLFVPAATTLGFAKTANPLVGVYQGTHTDTPPGLPSTFTFGVNIDNSVHGFTMFLRQRVGGIDQTPFLLEGAVTAATGVLAQPPGFNLGQLGTAGAFPGLVMFDNEGVIKFTPGTFAGTISAGAINGTWQTGPGVLLTGTFTGNLLP